MQFLEYGKSRDFFTDQQLNEIIGGRPLGEFLNGYDSVQSSLNLVTKAIENSGFSSLYGNSELIVATHKVIEKFYAEMFKTLDEAQESTRNLVQFVDEYIAYLTDEDIQLDDIKSYFESYSGNSEKVNPDITTYNKANLSETETEVGVAEKIEAGDGDINSPSNLDNTHESSIESRVEKSDEDLEAFKNGFSCQLEAIEKGLLDQYFSIVNEEVCSNLKSLVLEAGSYKDLDTCILPDIEVISSACNFVELPVSEMIFNTLAKLMSDEVVEIDQFRSLFDRGMDLVMKIYIELKSTGSECNVLSDNQFLNDLHKWTIEGKG